MSNHQNPDCFNGIDYICYTDGGCNPQCGTWAVVIVGRDGSRREYSGFKYAPVTINHMELWGIRMALANTSVKSRIRIVSDSQYSINCASTWCIKWARNGWRAKKQRPIKNLQLIQDIYSRQLLRDVSFQWVRGHSGHHGNERADQLCSAESKLARLMLMV